MIIMQIPAEYAWIIPIVVPFIIGLLVGAIIKRTLKMAILIVALVIVLIAMGTISLTYEDVYDKAMDYLPKIIDTGEGLKDVLPYLSITFIIGLALGLWKG